MCSVGEVAWVGLCVVVVSSDVFGGWGGVGRIVCSGGVTIVTHHVVSKTLEFLCESGFDPQRQCQLNLA